MIIFYLSKEFIPALDRLPLKIPFSGLLLVVELKLLWDTLDVIPTLLVYRLTVICYYLLLLIIRPVASLSPPYINLLNPDPVVSNDSTGLLEAR